MQEEGFDEFADPRANDVENVDPDIKCVGEIVSSAFHAEKTISPEEEFARNKSLYGDLAEQFWAGRPDQERQWMVPAQTDILYDLESFALPHPDRTVVLGTNGVLSFALQCLDSDRPLLPVAAADDTKEKQAEETKAKMIEELKKKKTPTNEEKGILIAAAYDEYASKNAAFAYKRSLAVLERRAFYLTTKYNIDKTHLKQDAKYLQERLDDMGKVDYSLREPITRLEPRLKSRIEKLPIMFKAGEKRPPQKWAQRPGNTHASVAVMTIDFLEPQPPIVPLTVGAGEELTFYRLLVCKTPTDYSELGKKKPKDKRPKWTDVNVVVETVSRTVPAGAFNDTHLALLYLPKTKEGNVIFVDIYLLPTAESMAKNGGTCKPNRERRFCFTLPEQFCQSGRIYLSLSSMGIVSMGYGNGVLVFDAMGLVEKIHVILLDGKEHPRSIDSCAVFHPQGAKREPIPSSSSSSPSSSNEDKGSKGKEEDTKEEGKEEEKKPPTWTGSILIGTDKGECYAIEWLTGHVFYVECTPAVEPIFGVHYSNGKVMMQTVMQIGGILSNAKNAVPTFAPMDRPVAFDSCGALIFILSKYGFLKIISSLAGDVAREIPPPKTTSRSTILQHAYKGLKAFPDHVVCVYPNGMVRNLVLSSLPPPQ